MRPSAILMAFATMLACDNNARRADVATPPVASTVDEITLDAQRTGDPQRGWDAIVGEPYVGCGVPRTLWDRFGMTPESWRIDRPRGDGLPYFLNEATVTTAHGPAEIVTPNCLGCHAAFLGGKLVIGLGEASMDFTTDQSLPLALAAMSLEREADKAALAKLTSRMRALAPYIKMRTVGANPADQIAAVLFAHRDPRTLAWSEEPLIPLPAADEHPIPVDVPAWWLMKKKTAMFHLGAGRGDHARIMMAASMLCVDDVATARQIDAYFPDVRAFILSLEAPAYSEPIDQAQAARGKPIFERACSKCHGTYGEGGSYRSKLVPLANVKTDPSLAQRSAQFAAPMTTWFARSFLGQIARLEPGNGYVAPPLDGVWATAPYFHNGSIPNLAAVLDTTQRHRRTRIIRGSQAYNMTLVGWPNDAAADEETGTHVYDSSHPGYSNAGHTYGDRLSSDERAAVLEYLKTL